MDVVGCLGPITYHLLFADGHTVSNAPDLLGRNFRQASSVGKRASPATWPNQRRPEKADVEPPEHLAARWPDCLRAPADAKFRCYRGKGRGWAAGCPLGAQLV